MSLNNISYYWVEAFKSLYRNSWLSLAAVGTIIISLFILGSSVLLVLNVNHLADRVESGVEISVFVQESVSGEELVDLGEQIKFLGGVESVNYISRERALEEMKESFGDRQDALAGLDEENTLPDSYRVKALSTDLVPSVAEKIEDLHGVDGVRYGHGVVEKLLVLSQWVRTMGLAIVVLLGVAAVFLIATTIRLSVYARRQEIGIMRILGATNWFIRMPFMLEGMLLGLLGGLVTSGVIYLGYSTLVLRVNATLSFIQLISQPQIIYYNLLGITALGLLLGILGSAISVRKFLKI
ncbi:MAG: ABC transporter permease [Firmicutes bacterium]|nr:ABC transporter permease [Bacillota bacterium]